MLVHNCCSHCLAELAVDAVLHLRMELVAGYNVEYSSMGYALFFLGEYANMIVMSSLCAVSFLVVGYLQ